MFNKAITKIKKFFALLEAASAKTFQTAVPKVTEVSVMVSKKTSINFQSCCVSYSVKATLDENDPDFLKALDDLRGQLVVKVQEALNGKKKTAPATSQEQAPNGGDITQSKAA